METEANSTHGNEPTFHAAQLIAERYQVIEALGGGIASEVYKVKDLVTSQVLALKITRPGISHDDELALNREFYHLSRFAHPSIVGVNDFGTSTDGRRYFTMEYSDGKPFSEFFNEGYTPALIPAMIQVLQALDVIHCQGLCHCDVKPQNILVSAGNADNVALKLLDFGFAEKISLSREAVSRGTLGYIAPEVFKGTGVDARADIYSLGMVVYEVLTGTGPRNVTDMLAWLRTQYGGLLPRPSEAGMRTARGAIPDGLERIVWDMIRRNAEDRPRSCLDVMERLSSISGIPVRLTAGAEPVNYLLAAGFVGRNEHLTKLGAMLTDAAAGKSSIVFISGERGVGKSRLMSEFRFLAELRGSTIFGFTPASLGARPQSLLESVIGFLRDFGGVNVAPEAGDGEWGEGRGKPDRPDGGWISGGSQPALGFAPDDNAAETERLRLFESCAAALRKVARSDKIAQSLLLLVDDFELFDPTSLDFLRYLVSSLNNDRLMIGICGLNERRLLELIQGVKNKSWVHHIALVPLRPDETRALVSSVLGEIPQLADLALWIHESSGGNPLFSVETIYSLIDRKILRLSASRWSVAMDELRSYRVPDTVSEVIKWRLQGLMPDELEVLRTGAVSGRPLDIEFLRVVLGYEEKQLFSSVSRLKAMGLMRPYAGEGVSSLILSSKMLESVVTESVSVAERRESHRRVALALELLYPESLDELIFDLAHHYTQAGIKDRAFSYAQKAGNRAFALHLTEQALTYYESAQSVAPTGLPPRERLQLIRRIGELREVLGRFDEARDIFTQGIGVVMEDQTLQKASDALPELLRAIGQVSQKAGRHDEALQYFEQAAAFLKGRADRLTAQLLLDTGWSHVAQNGYARAERLYDQANQLIEKLRDAPGAEDYAQLHARARYFQGVLEYRRASIDKALALVTEAIQTCEGVARNEDQGQDISHLTTFAATLHWLRGDGDSARRLYEKYLPLQRKRNNVFYLLRALNGIGISKLEACDWEGARTDFQEALGLAERIGDRTETNSILNNLGVIAEKVGDWDTARANYLKCQHLSAEAGDEPGLGTNLVNLAVLANWRGELDEAERLLKDALSIVSKLPQRTQEEAILLEQVQLELRRERLGIARQSLLRAFRLNIATHDLRQRPELRLAAAEYHLQTGEPDRAIRLLKPLLSFAVGPNAKGESPRVTGDQSSALYLQGRALGQMGRISEARQNLELTIQHARRLRTPYQIALGLFALATVRTTVNQPESLLRLKPALALRSLDRAEIEPALAEIKEAKEIFQRLGAKIELQRCDELQGRINQLHDSGDLRPRHQSEYLRVFYKLSEIINQGLEQEDFMDRILDQALEATGAERGLLFLTQGERLVTAAGRGIDHTTLQDAQNISRTLLKQVNRRAEPMMTADALGDPRFSSANSVSLNKIRSILSAPLAVGDRVIGAIYLDSRINTHLFGDEDRDFVMSIANMLAATIDRSIAFRKIQDDPANFQEEVLADATGYYPARSKAMREVYHMVERIAPTDATVLLLGETGTGKTVIAKLIHGKSKRKGNRFLKVDCGTLPEQLFESELFGHAKGSFTGAVKDKEGLFEMATGGTIFLDEITNTSLATQGKLLQAIEDKAIRRVGETEMRPVDVRLVCATNRDLLEDVRTGHFREDLFYRLNVVRITVPPLRVRSADIPGMANFLLRRYSRTLNKPILGFEDQAMAALMASQWPGNVRELQNFVERASIMCQRRKISLEDLGLTLTPEQAATAAAKEAKAAAEAAGKFTREEVLKAMADSQGNISGAARRLGTHRRQIQRLLKRYEIDKKNIESAPAPGTPSANRQTVEH